MKYLTLVVLAVLALGTLTQATAKPNPRLIVRDCARQLCADIRNCSSTQPELVGKNAPAKDATGKSSEQTQDHSETCYGLAYQSFLMCTNEEPPGLLGKDQPNANRTDKTSTQSK